MLPVSAPSLAIEASEVTKTFRSGWLRRRETVALRGATLSVERGTIFGLLGPNGAGKTTLLSILGTLLTPDGGQVRVLGHDVVHEAARLRHRINMASGRPSFLWSLRVDEIVSFYGRLYGLHGLALRRRVDELIEQYELTPYRRAQYNELSTGIKQRVALAKALVNDPELLFLDEPTLGLDPDVSVRVRQHIAALRRAGRRRSCSPPTTARGPGRSDESLIKAGRIWPTLSRRPVPPRRSGLGDVIALPGHEGPAWLGEEPLASCAASGGRLDQGGRRRGSASQARRVSTRAWRCVTSE
jgi:ABC-2 type transport system ATP-binding protein